VGVAGDLIAEKEAKITHEPFAPFTPTKDFEEISTLLTGAISAVISARCREDRAVRRAPAPHRGRSTGFRTARELVE
jgi:hypothetical protein